MSMPCLLSRGVGQGESCGRYSIGGGADRWVGEVEGLRVVWGKRFTRHASPLKRAIMCSRRGGGEGGAHLGGQVRPQLVKVLGAGLATVHGGLEGRRHLQQPQGGAGMQGWQGVRSVVCWAAPCTLCWGPGTLEHGRRQTSPGQPLSRPCSIRGPCNCRRKPPGLASPPSPHQTTPHHHAQTQLHPRHATRPPPPTPGHATPPTSRRSSFFQSMPRKKGCPLTCFRGEVGSEGVRDFAACVQRQAAPGWPWT